ncbi:hypothetical protein ACNOYE_04640 [Nannocystaceae bacterium ST9]
MRLDDITGETIQKASLEPEVFEVFVGLLLREEFQSRHAAEVGNGVEGPGSRGSRGPWDMRVRVTKPPRLAAFATPLTFDDVGETWYSCKTGPNWLKLVRRDVGGQETATKKQSRKVKKSTKKSRQTNPSDALLDHFERGGRYIICIDRQVGDDRVLDEVDTAIRTACKARGRTQTKSSHRDQIHLVTAERLAEFVRVHRPSLTEPLREALGIVEPDGLLSWTEWGVDLHGEQGHNRDPIPFEYDDLRQSIVESLDDPELQVVRISGPPGVGKTRVVYEGLLRSLSEQASAVVRYAKDPERVRDVVDSSQLRAMGGIVLVCDETRTIDFERIESLFRVRADPKARLIFIGTSDAQSSSSLLRHFVLERLDDARVRSLVIHEAPQASEAQVAAIVRSSGGYPWYAVLLARATAPDSVPLTEPELEDAWRMARRVLATYARDESEDQWKEKVEARARCLLISMLTHELEIEWDELREVHRGPLEAFLAALSPQRGDSSKVWAAERDCRERQILRYSGGSRVHRYVSPNLLAKIILEHFFGGDDDGPRNLRRLLEHAPDFRAPLARILAAVGAHPDIATKLAQLEWDEFLRRAQSGDLDALEHFAAPESPSSAAAHQEPEHAIEAMTGMLDLLSPDHLALIPRTRSTIAFALGRALRRRLSTEVFEHGECLAFKLAQRETSEHINPAIRLWRSLFRPQLSLTHTSWSTRLRLLDAHLAAQDEWERGKAVEALGRALDMRSPSMGFDDEDLRDGEWPSLTMPEWLAANHQLWARLLEACTHDDKVGAFARGCVADNLRSGLEHGLSAEQLQQLAVAVYHWSPDERSSLVDKLTNVHRYDAARLSRNTLDTLAALGRSLQPKDTFEQLQQHVGQWHPGPWTINDPKRPQHEAEVDDQLARRLIDEGQLESTLAWLVRPEAWRRRNFAGALGRIDHDRRALAILRASAEHRNQHLLSSYLLGWLSIEGSEPVDGWIGQNVDAQDLGPELLFAIGLMPPSKHHLEWFIALVRRGTPSDVVSVPWQSWIDVLPAADLLELAPMLRSYPALGIDLLLDLLDAPSIRGLEARVLDELHELLRASTLDRIVIGNQYDWKRGVLRLGDASRFEAVVELLVRSFVTTGTSNVAVEQATLRELFERGLGPRLWPAFARLLLDPTRVSELDWRLHRVGALAKLDADEVLTWVGHDAGRARILARIAAPYDERLDAITRGLLARFGAASMVGKQLTLEARSSAGISWIEPAIAFERQQLANARAWQTNHPEPEVQRWAAQLEQHFARLIAEHEARREFRRIYG